MAFLIMSKLLDSCQGDTSAAIYSLLLLGASKSATDWASAWIGAVDMLRKYTVADVGDRTMVKKRKIIFFGIPTPPVSK